MRDKTEDRIEAEHGRKRRVKKAKQQVVVNQGDIHEADGELVIEGSIEDRVTTLNYRTLVVVSKGLDERRLTTYHGPLVDNAEKELSIDQGKRE